MLRGYIEAHQRAELILHPLIQGAGDPISALLSDTVVCDAKRPKVEEIIQANLFFARVTDVRLSDQLDEVAKKCAPIMGGNLVPPIIGEPSTCLRCLLGLNAGLH